MTHRPALVRGIFVLALAVAWIAPAFLAPPTADAQAALYAGFGGPAGFGTDILNRNDDGSTPAIDLTGAFSGGLRFYGGPYTQMYVNNNGNVTFNMPQYMWVPNAFPIASQPMIAPYWADVDTRNASVTDPAENLVYYHLEPGRLVVTWFNVGYFSEHNEHRMSFQLIITNANGCGSGDFDVEFRYNRCEWDTGTASGDSNGNGTCDPTGADCTAAQAGFDAGNLHDYTALPGSFSNNIMNVCTTSNIDMPGVWEFSVRAGGVVCREDMPCTVDGAVGACSIGRTQCVSNVAVCQAIYTPTAELCDAVDNDCNGMPDDAAHLCPSMQSCVLGACVNACFEGACPTDYTCDATLGVCVETACIGHTCAADERCEAGACVSACEGVVCPHGHQCISGVCIDPCAAVTCAADRLCRGGICVLRCPCSPCAVGETCLADGSCQARGCDVVNCPEGDYCEGGACHDACMDVHCPRGQECALGNCVLAAGHDAGPRAMDAGTDAAVDADVPVDAGMDAGMITIPDAGSDASHGPPVPANNCGCSVGGQSDRPWGVALIALGLVLALGRKKSRQ